MQLNQNKLISNLANFVIRNKRN